MKNKPCAPASRRQPLALARWNGEGGAGPGGRPPAPQPPAEAAGWDAEGAEPAQLRMRVIALESLVVTLLSCGGGPTRSLMRKAAQRMAEHISPRPGSTPHAPTLRAAAQMQHLLSCARRLHRRHGER